MRPHTQKSIETVPYELDSPDVSHDVTVTAILRQVEVLAPNRASGRRRADNETLLYAMLKVLETGMPWRHLEWPGNGPNYRSVHRHFMAWCRAGVFRSAYQALLRLYARKTRRGEYHCIDSSYVKSIYGVACVGRNPTDRGRNATKMSAIVTDEGLPVSLTFFPANTSDYRTVYASLDARVSRTRARIPLYADKGYDSTEVRHALWDAGYVDRVAKRKCARIVLQTVGEGSSSDSSPGSTRTDD